jgi:hypothetical protein
MFKSRKIAKVTFETPAICLSRKLALEPRYVFDAALAADLLGGQGFIDVTVDPAAQSGYSGESIASAMSEISSANALPLGATAEDVSLVELHNQAPFNHQIAFIDSRLEGLDQLINAVPSGTRVILIDGARDGVVQMVEALRGESGISGIHLISHGSEGNLQLGSAVLNSQTMDSVYRSALASISSNLSDSADILIYGCNFAAGDSGMAAAGLLAKITGADVAASEDLTGGESGADWQLERNTGDIESASLVADDWNDTLVTINIQDGSGSAIRNQAYNGTLVGLASAIDPPTGVTFTAGTFATTHGSVVIQSNGAFTYTPNSGYLGSDGFVFEAIAIDPNDGIPATATAIFQVQVNPDPNYIISASGETNSVGHQNPGNTLSFNGTVVDNVTPSVLGGPITSYTLVSSTSNGTLTFNADGTFNYHPNAGFSGQDSFVFSANDSSADSDPASATVVFNVAPPPLDAYGYTTVVSHNTSVTVTPGQYEADPLATFSYVPGSAPGGTLISNGDGSFTFTPDVGFSGNVSIPYTVTDSNGYVSTDYITFIVDSSGGTGIAPLQAWPETYTLQQGNAAWDAMDYYALPSNGVAPIYSISIAAAPSHGTITAFNPVSGAYTYEATPGYIGTDTITFTVTDQYGQTATSIETINIVEPYFETTPRVVFAPIGAAVAGNLGGQTQEWVAHTTENFYIDGQLLTTGATIPTAHGVLTVTDGATGAYSWQPNAGFSGPEVINWTSRNYWGAGANDFYETEQSSDTIISPNRIYAGHRGFALETGSTLTGTVTSYSGSPTGWPSYSMPWGASNGTAALDSSGNYTYTPNAGFVGIDRFGYTVANGLGNTATNYITVLVTGPREPGNLDPVALVIPDRTNIDTDTVGGVSIAGFFTDPDGDAMTFVADGLPTGLSMDSAGNITGTIDGHASTGGFSGQYEVSVFALDGRGGVVQQTFLWTVSNPVPNAVDDGTTTPFNTAVVVDLGANDSDPDGDTFTVVSADLANPADGTLSNVGGVWTFTPASGFTGLATINYTIQDQDGATDTAQHLVTVGAANAPPTLVDPNPANPPGDPSIDPTNPSNLIVPAVDNVLVSVDLDQYFTDPNGDTLTITPDLTGLPSWVTYDPVTHVLGGTPPVDNVGPVVVPVTVTDGNGGTYTATITITPTNPGPDAVNDATTTPFNTPVTVNLLANDTDPDGDPLSVTAATLANPADGTLTNVGGVWTFTPAAGFTGNAVINYTIQDQDGATDIAQHTISVAMPSAPIAVNDSYTTPYETPINGDVRGGDTYAPGSTFSQLSSPMNGSVTFNGDGTYTYTPAPGFVGTETFAYQVTDPFGRSSVAFEVIRVSPPPLVAVNDSYTTPYNTALNGSAAAGDTFAPGSTFLAITVPSQGTLAFNADGTYIYTPPLGFSGTVMFAYAVTDPTGQTRFATDTITIQPPPQPVAVDDSYVTAYQTTLSGNAATADTYQPGSVFAATSQPTHGTLTFNPDGSYSYVPTAGYAGTDSFTYSVTDSLGNSDTATETITITPPALVAVNDAYTGLYGVPVTGDASGGDSFAPGSAFAIATPPTNGSVIMNGNGTFTYTPAPGFSGTVTFTYTVTDPTGQQALATETIVITPPALLAVDDSYTTVFNTPVNGNAATGDTYVPGSVFAVLAAPTQGSVTMSSSGTYVYTPPANFIGTVTFTYQVTDPTGQVRTATETIVVSPPLLTAVNDTYTTPFNTPLNGNAALGDVYAPGSVFSATSSPNHGTVVMNANGTYRYIPALNFTGTDTFTYTITDPTGRTVTATETITVSARPTLYRCLTTFANHRRP